MAGGLGQCRLVQPLRSPERIYSLWHLSAGSISTADGSALVRLGKTTVVCGVKAEIAEPELDSPEDGFLGECKLSIDRCLGSNPLCASPQLGSTCNMPPEIQTRSTYGRSTGPLRQTQ